MTGEWTMNGKAASDRMADGLGLTPAIVDQVADLAAVELGPRPIGPSGQERTAFGGRATIDAGAATVVISCREAGVAVGLRPGRTRQGRRNRIGALLGGGGCWVNAVYATFPPTDVGSITELSPPTLAAAVKSQDTTGPRPSPRATSCASTWTASPTVRR